MTASKAQARAKVKPTNQAEPSVSFAIPLNAWRDSADSLATGAHPFSRLYASVSINGVGFHCEAIEVYTNEEGLFDARAPFWAGTLNSYYEACGAEGPMQTVRIAGRDYAVFLTPFC